ncbi:MAG: hypothetical protein ACXVH2_00855 [Methanobacterium sp.]
MTTIQRYTQTGIFRRLEKQSDGELCYFYDHNNIIIEKDELIDKLSKNNQDMYEYKERLSLRNDNLRAEIDLLKLSKQIYKDKLTESRLLTKKYSVIGFVSMVINIILLGYLWMN